ncbi:retrovirus-related pol polyprotein from transposon TNT 1-94, partial [Tanacetum coccineum]
MFKNTNVIAPGMYKVLNAKTSNVNFICVTYGKCVLNDNHDLCVLHYINGVNSTSRTANILEHKTPRCSTVSNTPSSSNSFAACRDSSIHQISGNGQVRKSTCYIRDLKGNDLLTGSRGTDLYSISLQDSTTPNPICLMAKATSSQAWLWHRRLSHLNFDTINLLLKNNIVNGLPKLKFVKDHLCSSCELGKAKRKSFHTKVSFVFSDVLPLHLQTMSAEEE